MDSENITPIQFREMYQNNPKKETANERKATEIAQSVSFFWTNEDDAEKSIIDTVALREAVFNAALQAMAWKDETNTEENHIRYKIFRKNVDEFIDKDREDTIDFITEWLDNETDLPDVLIEDLANALRQANEEKNKICRRNRKEDEV